MSTFTLGAKRCIDKQGATGWIVYAIGVILMLLCPYRINGQIDQGAITGVVTDSTGAAISGAQVTLANQGTGLVLSTKTNASGDYFFTPIKTGTYTVSASAPNFETTQQTNIVLHVTDRLNIPLALRPGNVSATVTVTSAAPLMQVETGETAVDISSQFLNDSPLANRNWVYIAQEAAGVVPSNGTRGGGTGDFEANGQHAEQNNFILDGVDNNINIIDYMNGSTYNIAPPPDAISEFKLETSDYSAEIGRGHGTVLNATTKSGTNQFHGDLWEYFRNTDIDAIPWNTNRALPIPPFHLNQFGATFGGPIIHNKLFYFGDIQDSRYAFGQPTTTYSVPTPLERQGNFTELLNPALTSNAEPIIIYEPNCNAGKYAWSGSGSTAVPTTLSGCLQQNGSSSTTVNGYTYPTGQNVFNPASLDTVAQNILNLYPKPNANGWNSSNNSNNSTVAGTTFNNYVVSLYEWSDPFQWDQRVDWNLSSRDQAYVRYSYQHLMNVLTSPLGPILDGYGGFQGHTENYLSENVMVSETHTFSPTLINEFRFGFNWGKFANLQYNDNVNEAASLGMNNMPFSQGPLNGGLPPVTISGNASIQAFGSHSNDPSIEGENIYQILDNATKTMGNHSLKMGFEFMPIRDYGTAVGASRGTYTFSGQFTSLTGISNTGSGVADFIAQGYTPSGSLTGTDNMGGGGLSNYELNNWDYGYIAGYIQDNWRTTRKLTLDFGIRYEYFTPKKENAGAWVNWVRETGQVGPNGGYGSALFELPANNRGVAIAQGIASLLAYDNIQIAYSANPYLSTFPKANWSPRLGVAYQVDNRTVVRMGGGIFFGGFEPGGGSSQTQNVPFVISSNLTLNGCASNAGSGTGGYCPSLYAQSDTLENGLQSFIGNGIANYVSFPNIEEQDPVMHVPYTFNYNLSVERALTGSMTATVGYIGNLGRHLVTLVNGPAMPQALTVAGPNNKSLSSAPQWNSAQWMTWEGENDYNSFQATVQKRYAHGLSFLGTYTWAHSIDDTADLLGGDINGYRMAALIPVQMDRTNSNYDVRNRVSVNGDYELPFGRGRTFLNRSGVMDEIIGGWKTNLTWLAQTGEPFTVGISNQTNAQGPYNNHAHKIANPFATSLTPPVSTPTTNSPGVSACPTQAKTITHWYNECAFTNPLGSAQVAAYATGTYQYSSPQISGDTPITVAAGTPYINTLAAALPFLGDVSNNVPGPGYWRVNMSMFKDFRTWHEQYLEFRADAFNLFNHPTWANPSSSTGDNAGNAGVITAPISFQNNTIDARFFQLSGKYVF